LRKQLKNNVSKIDKIKPSKLELWFWNLHLSNGIREDYNLDENRRK
jgi:hypothetical protein